MKKKVFYFLSVLSLSVFQSCENHNDQSNTINTDLVYNAASASSQAEKDNGPVFEFEKETHDFGEIAQGEKVSHSFKFKNTGQRSLIISSASGSCGCTVPQYPKNPIPPGESASIEVEFNSEGKEGRQDKSVTLMANTNPASKILKISGNVIVPSSSNN